MVSPKKNPQTVWNLVILLEHPGLGITFDGKMNHNEISSCIAGCLGRSHIQKYQLQRSQAKLARALKGTKLPRGSHYELYSKAYKELRSYFVGAEYINGNVGVSLGEIKAIVPHIKHTYTGTFSSLNTWIQYGKLK